MSFWKHIRLRVGATWAVLLAACLPVYGQSNVTLSGYVRDAETGETLIGATVYAKELKTGATTNAYGFYSLDLPEGANKLRVSYVGYEPIEEQLTLETNAQKDYSLKPTYNLTEAVVVEESQDEDYGRAGVSMSRERLDIRSGRITPVLFNRDPTKEFTKRPGVLSVSEGTSSFYVRGGRADHNLILMDEAPIYDPSHFFGLVSIFNPDAVKSVDLYKGGIPARYGGRLASIMEVRTRDGNFKRFGGSAGIGMLAAGMLLEGPIVKDKASYLFSARRSYADLLLPFSPDEDTRENNLWFYDLNLKLNWQLSETSKLYVSGYFGRDRVAFDDDYDLTWGNATASIRLNRAPSAKLFVNSTLVFSRFDYRMALDDGIDGLIWKAKLQDVHVKEDYAWYLNAGNRLDFGWYARLREFSPGEIEPIDEASTIADVSLNNEASFEYGIYLSDKFELGEKWTIEAGARLSFFQAIGPTEYYEYADPADNAIAQRDDTTSYASFETAELFYNLEPRVSVRYGLGKKSALKASYNRMAQYVHLVSNTTIPLPFNTWAPSSPYLDPQLADQFAIGYYTYFGKRETPIEVSIEAYYKEMQDVTEFADNAILFFNQDIATEYRQGDATSYGLELAVEKNQGQWQGFVSYTLSRTEQTILGVNFGETFPANYDRRHSLRLSGSYQSRNRKWLFSANFYYASGRPVTLPEGKYRLDENYYLPYFTGRNQYRMPDAHRLDLAVNFKPGTLKRKRVTSEWSFGIYNAYNRKNPFALYASRPLDDNGNGIPGRLDEKEVRMIYLFTAIPTFSYQVKF